MQSWFIWKGKNSREMGVWVSAVDGETRAAERATYITIPGRSGTLKLSDGENVFDAYTMQIVVTSLRRNNLEYVNEWLSGKSDLILNDSSNRAREAEISSMVAWSNISNDLCQATIAFHCQPLKKQFPEENAFSGQTSTYTIYNPGNVPSKPLVTLSVNAGTASLRIANKQMDFSADAFSTTKSYVSGDCVNYGTMYRFTQQKAAGDWDSSKVVLIPNLVVDCEAKTVYTLINNVQNIFQGNIVGDFFEIPVGSSSVYANANNNPIIVPRWRWK